MNQIKPLDTPPDDIGIPPDSLESRANQMYEYILNIYSNLDLTNFYQHIDDLSQRIFLSDEEKKVALPYILNKITQKVITEYSQKNIVLASGNIIAHPKQFLIIALSQMLIEAIFDQESATFDLLALDKASLSGVQLSYLSIVKHLALLSGNNSSEELFINQTEVGSEFFGLTLELYPLGSPQRSPGYWIDMFQKLQGNRREFLKSVPFIWGEKEFRSCVQRGFNQSHVRINGKQYKVNEKAKSVWEKSLKQQKKIENQGWERRVVINDNTLTIQADNNPQWCIYMTMDDEGPSIEYIPTSDHNKFLAFSYKHKSEGLVSSEISLNRTITQKLDKEELDKNIKTIFLHTFISYDRFFDEQIFATSLDNLRKFDMGESTQTRLANSVVESASHNATTLINKVFIDPKQHHTDIAHSLGLDIVDHGNDIGMAEGVIAMPHLRYKSQNGESSLHYLPKIAWLIDLLKDIIPRNEHGKITAYTLPSSPYVFIYTNTGTIFISDVDNIATQVFAQKVDPSFINTDFSFSALGGLFGPLTSIKNNFEEVISDEKAESWAKNIVDALAKKDGYFPDLMSDGQPRWGINLRALYHSGEMTKKNFATPIALKQFLENYNRIILLRSDITIKQKQDLSVVNSRGGVPNTQSLINALGGHSFFTSYHGHAPFFS
ncbi:MAG: hypothetical protein U0518_02245 [Candidatus Gracilibacteria bacterium]